MLHIEYIKNGKLCFCVVDRVVSVPKGVKIVSVHLVFHKKVMS